jgi:hypothetical protein
MTAQQWGDLARGMYPGYTGHRPRVQLFHGDADTIISYKNFGEAIKEWTNVLALPTSPTSMMTGLTLGSHQATRQQWKNACGYVVLDAITSIGGDHGPSDALFKDTYVIPFLGLDKTGDVDPEIAACSGGPDGGAGGSGGAGGRGGSGGSATDGGVDGSGAGGNAGATGRGGNTGAGGGIAGASGRGGNGVAGASGGTQGGGGASAGSSGAGAVGGGAGGATATAGSSGGPSASGAAGAGGNGATGAAGSGKGGTPIAGTGGGNAAGAGAGDGSGSGGWGCTIAPGGSHARSFLTMIAVLGLAWAAAQRRRRR